MVNKLLVQGIEIQRASKPFTTSAGMMYPAGSFVVSMAQPKMGLIRYLLGRTFYPDNEWTRNRDGSPIRPYDMATDTMFEYMGVRVDPVDELGEVAMEKVAGADRAGRKSDARPQRLLDGRPPQRQLPRDESAVRQGRGGAPRGQAVRRPARRRFSSRRRLRGGARNRRQADRRRFHAAARSRSPAECTR